jgi:hypothetical protein
LVERRNLFSKGGEDSFGRIAGLEARKERMRSEVCLGLPFVGFHGSVKNGHKVGTRGGCGRFCGHGELLRREGESVMSEW